MLQGRIIPGGARLGPGAKTLHRPSLLHSGIWQGINLLRELEGKISHPTILLLFLPPSFLISHTQTVVPDRSENSIGCDYDPRRQQYM